MSAAGSGDGDALGPVDYVVVEFPDGQLAPGGFERLLDLVDRRVIQVLDVEFLVTLLAVGVGGLAIPVPASQAVVG